MEERPGWSAGDIDLDRPNAARVYDFYLGGSHNFAVDRRMAEQAIADWPDLPTIIGSNRSFLRRAVRFLTEAGIRQFLDLGSGIPTVGNVHEVAQRSCPDARVAYVDIDPVAVAHSRLILAGNPQAAAVRADLRQPAQLLADAEVSRVLDFSQPVAVLMVAVLHFVPDADDPAGIIAQYRDAIAPGSYLVLSHATQDGQPEQAAPHQALYNRTATPMTMRSLDEVTKLLDGFDVVDPGVVRLPLWRPDPGSEIPDRPDRFAGYAAVGRLDRTP